MSISEIKKPTYPNLEAELGRYGLSYKKFGELIGLNKQTIVSRMTGNSEFKLPEIRRILKLFNKTFEELFC